MSITSNFPAIKPTLLLDFANTKQLDPRITFTRASTATYYGTQTAKAEENLLLQSQDFTTTWSNVASTDTANTDTAPDGTTTADTITANAGTTLKGIQQNITLSGTYTYSVFAKAGTHSIIQLLFGGAGNAASAYANFNIAAGSGAVGNTSGTSSIVDAGNGWYRCVFTGDFTGGTSVYVSFIDSTTAARAASSTSTGTLILWGAQLEQRSAVSSYTVTTTATITNYIPQLLTAASGVARFDNNPTTFESLGLLSEESRTNLILQSEDLDTTWTETRATLSLNSVVAPNGALTADRLIASTDNNTHFSSQTFTGTAASYTFTVYAKASGLNHVALRLFNGTSQVGLAYYNLSTGATGTVTAGTAAITSVGNNYYRCSLTATLAASASCTADIQLANADNTNSFIGNAFDGVTLWGTQVELGAFATSYIPTVASQVTRAADAASMTGTNFSSWYNQAEGTMYTESATNNSAAVSSSAAALFASASNYQRIRHVGALIDITAVSSGTTTVDTDGVAVTVGVFGKTVMGFRVNDYAQYTNASSGGTDSSAVLPVGINVLNIGSTDGSSNNLNGIIRKIAYYPLRVTNAQLQALTS